MPDSSGPEGSESVGVRWRVDLICCGREHAHIVRETWEEADEFRRSYEHDACGVWPHDRRGILVRDHAHTGTCNGYARNCPLPGGSFLEVAGA